MPESPHSNHAAQAKGPGVTVALSVATVLLIAVAGSVARSGSSRVRVTATLSKPILAHDLSSDSAKGSLANVVGYG